MKIKNIFLPVLAWDKDNQKRLYFVEILFMYVACFKTKQAVFLG
ncbi:hypothetical protein BN1088_1430815 [Sphingobacterium sp. PM2-P1-29]|nr:hypothetical protein BN1088_1430815 [Sphingobacterium sp. PM2-P1-29]